MIHYCVSGFWVVNARASLLFNCLSILLMMRLKAFLFYCYNENGLLTARVDI
jgi:hypothetical protein